MLSTFNYFQEFLANGFFTSNPCSLRIPYDLDSLSFMVIYLALPGVLILMVLVLDGSNIHTGFLHSGDQTQSSVY